MSALCRNLLELKNGKNISQNVFLTGEEILPGYIRLPKITSLGNSYLRYYTGLSLPKKNLKNLILKPTTIAISALGQIL